LGFLRLKELEAEGMNRQHLRGVSWCHLAFLEAVVGFQSGLPAVRPRAEVLELSPDFLGPALRRVGEEREVGIGLLCFEVRGGCRIACGHGVNLLETWFAVASRPGVTSARPHSLGNIMRHPVWCQVKKLFDVTPYCPRSSDG